MNQRFLVGVEMILDLNNISNSFDLYPMLGDDISVEDKK